MDKKWFAIVVFLVAGCRMESGWDRSMVVGEVVGKHYAPAQSGRDIWGPVRTRESCVLIVDTSVGVKRVYGCSEAFFKAREGESVQIEERPIFRVRLK